MGDKTADRQPKCVSAINMIKSKKVYKNDICCNWSMWKWKV